jgi:serine/threonine protein kinase
LSSPSSSITKPTYLDLSTHFYLHNAADIFNSGTFLGGGGQGEVRRVELLGHQYALRRATRYEISNERRTESIQGPWAQKHILYDYGDEADALYSLYELAAGDLHQALDGHSIAAVSGSSHGGCGQTAMLSAVSQPLPQPAACQPAPQPAPCQPPPQPAAPQKSQEGPTKPAPFKKLLRSLFKPANKKPPPVQPASPLMPTATAKALAAELITAVGTVHDAGVAHFDIKPGNVLVAADNHLTLCDFGCALPASMPAMCAGGTPLFMAPEQHVDIDSFLGRLSILLRSSLHHLATWCGLKHDSRPADVWALGATLVTMLLPPAEADAALAAARAGKKWVPAPGSVGAALPADLRDLLFRGMLARRPGRRLTVRQLKGHAFFAGVDWAAVEARTVPLPVDLVALAKIGREAEEADAAAAAAASTAAAGAGVDPVT